MSWWKQVALVAVLFILGGLVWLRLSPNATAYLGSIGLSPSLTAALTGSPAGDGRAAGKARQPGPGGRGREVLVVTAPVATARINDRVTAIGDGEALRSVTVVPLSAGVITAVKVAAGEKVEAGQILAKLDSDAETIARDRASLALRTARDKLDRYRQLATSHTMTAVQVSDAQSEYENARLALRDAELTLKRRAIVAPIGGSLGIIPVEVGDYATTQTNIATIDDRSKILVDFWVPERFAGTIKVGQSVEAVAIAMPDKLFTGKVAVVASRIERDSRTLQVRAELDNSGDTLRPGMSFKVTMHFPGESFPAVNPLAIQWSSDGAFVWKERQGVAVKTPVRIVQRNSDSVLVEGALAAGEETVIEGVQTLREGVKLRVAGDAGQPPAAGS